MLLWISSTLEAMMQKGIPENWFYFRVNEH
jgi:hypothetical protein